MLEEFGSSPSKTLGGTQGHLESGQVGAWSQGARGKGGSL